MYGSRVLIIQTLDSTPPPPPSSAEPAFVNDWFFVKARGRVWGVGVGMLGHQTKMVTVVWKPL